MVGSFPLWEWDRTARREPRPPEGNRGDLLQDNTRWLPPAACHGMSLQLVLFLSFVVKLPHTAHFSFC